jgi:plasmid stabilization system protein ParE
VVAGESGQGTIAFEDDLDALLRRLAEQPRLIGRPVSGRVGLRRVELPRIRYYVYFQIVHDEGSVVLLAIRHTSRSGGPRL